MAYLYTQTNFGLKYDNFNIVFFGWYDLYEFSYFFIILISILIFLQWKYIAMLIWKK